MGISIRAYAQQRGVSHEAVRKAIASGRIQPEPDGSIDSAKADAQWDRHTRTVQPITPKASSTRASAAPAPIPQASDDARGVDYHKARAVRETYSARLAKLEFEERTAKLISKDEVDIKYFQLARQLRDRMQQIPRKVAPEIVALVVADPDVRGVTDILDVGEVVGKAFAAGLRPDPVEADLAPAELPPELIEALVRDTLRQHLDALIPVIAREITQRLR